jgi:hypothetical protein
MTPEEAEKILIKNFLSQRKPRLLVDFYQLTELGVNRNEAYWRLGDIYGFDQRSVQRVVRDFERKIEG